MRSVAVVGGLLIALNAFAAPIGEIDVRSGPPASRPTEKDRSGLYIHSGTFASLLVTDVKGKRVGVDPKTKQTLQEIPNSACSTDFMANKYTGDEKSEVDEQITFEPAAKGIYLLHLTGLRDGPYALSISALSREGSSLPSKDLDGIISEGQEKIFKLSFDPAPNSQLTVVEETAK